MQSLAFLNRKEEAFAKLIRRQRSRWANKRCRSRGSRLMLCAKSVICRPIFSLLQVIQQAEARASVGASFSLLFSASASVHGQSKLMHFASLGRRACFPLNPESNQCNGWDHYRPRRISALSRVYSAGVTTCPVMACATGDVLLYFLVTAGGDEKGRIFFHEMKAVNEWCIVA